MVMTRIHHSRSRTHGWRLCSAPEADLPECHLRILLGMKTTPPTGFSSSPWPTFRGLGQSRIAPDNRPGDDGNCPWLRIRRARASAWHGAGHVTPQNPADSSSPAIVSGLRSVAPPTLHEPIWPYRLPPRYTVVRLQNAPSSDAPFLE